jgi:hypothetical protein
MATPESSASGLMTVDDYVQLPAIPADHRLCYGPDPAQFGDLYLPPQPGPHPVIITFTWRRPAGAIWTGPLRTAV